jgi:hypothetical protein
VSFLWETDFEKIGLENAFGNLYEESDEESESGDQLGVGLKRGGDCSFRRTDVLKD